MEISSSTPALVCGLSDLSIASFGFLGRRMNRTLGGYKTVLGRFCDFVLPFRCDEVFLDESICVVYQVFYNRYLRYVCARF